MTIDNELIDNLLKDYQKPEDLIGENGLLKELTKRLLERAMAVFPDGKPPTDRQRRQEAMDRMESRSKPVWNKCDSEFYDQKEDIGELCLQYAKKKRAEIILP